MRSPGRQQRWRRRGGRGCRVASCSEPSFCLDTVGDDELRSALAPLLPAVARTVVTVPTYQEAANIDELVTRILALPLPGLRVVVADDVSGGNTMVENVKCSDGTVFSSEPMPVPPVPI